jgi:hypothetical protein
MMKRINSFFFLIAVVALLALSCACPPSEEKYCCEQYKGDDGGTFDDARLSYCTYHRQAAIGFVRRGADSLEIAGRLEEFKLFYEKIDGCGTVVCIEDAIQADPALSEFWDIYQVEHRDAEDFTDLPESVSKADLILCGFRNAIINLEEAPLGT